MAVAGSAIRNRLTTELFASADVQDAPAQGFDEYAVIGGVGNAPLVLVPSTNLKAAANTVLRWTDATTPTDLGRRLAGWAGIRAGAALRSRERVFVRTTSASKSTLHEHLAKAIDLPTVAISASFGPPRPNQKPVVRIFDDEGKTRAFAKIGWNTLTKDLVDGEAAFLRSGTASLRTIAAPSVISNESWNDRSVAVMPALEGKPPFGSAPRPSPAMLEEVAGLSDRYWATISESPYRATLAGSPEGETGNALQLIDERWSDTAIPFGHWHGDWTPWNMRHVGSRLIVWDWERNAAHTPVGFDSIHYEFQKRAVRAGHKLDVLLESIAAASDSLAALGVLRAATPAVATLYLVELNRRFGAASEGEPEAAIAHRAEINALLRASIAHFSV